MPWFWIAVAFLAGAAVAAALVGSWARAGNAALRATLEESRNASERTVDALLERAKNELRETTAARASERVGELVAPVAEKLAEFDKLMREIEGGRRHDAGGLREQISSLLARTEKLETAAAALSSQTSSLVSALRNPATRGKWGEVQLRRVVELAGMEPYCDFAEQQTFDSDDGQGRPDMTVALPGNSVIFVDAKVPLAAFLEAIDAQEEAQRRERLRAHAGAMKNHVDALARKNYQRADGSADFVVMFVPGEAFLSAACTENPDLIEYAAGRHVYVASPLTLIALLRSYALGWQQRRQEENSKQIAAVGRELYERVRVFATHLSAIGGNLQKAVASYNSAVGSLEGRLLPQGRKLKEVAALPDADLPDMHAVEVAPRQITAMDAGAREGRTPRAPQLFSEEDAV
ncbi:MAG TPA: DNA recombination protein RmuC [Verrucomicrobiae bacterium]|nr:DNA recombination protein RmuC [Verrucomicrobiae bacterium]